MNTVQVAVLSDTHGSGPKGPFADGELLLHAGDFTTEGAFHQLNIAGQKFSQAYPGSFIGTPGNHDELFEQNPGIARQALGGTILIDELIESCGLRIWGSPWTLTYGQYAFMGDEAKLWRQLTGARLERPDILITHSPPLGILDMTTERHHVGSQAVLDTIHDIKPALVICGHIHEAAGTHRLTWDQGSTLIINAASREGVCTRVTMTRAAHGWEAALRET